MDSLIKINIINDKGNKLPLLSENQERNKFVCLFNRLDTKLEITEDKSNCVDKMDLQKHVTANYFDYFHYRNIDFVKRGLKIYFMFSTKEQDCSYEYQYVKFRYALIDDAI